MKNSGNPPIDLFVYGTLRTGQPLADWLESSTLWKRPAYIKGTLYPIYSGAYPVAFLDEDGLIFGEIRTCAMTDSFIQCVMMEQGAGYVPLEVPVLDKDGKDTEKLCVAFHFPHRKPGTARITSGDWVQWVTEMSRQTPTVCPHCFRVKSHTCMDENNEPFHFTQTF